MTYFCNNCRKPVFRIEESCDCGSRNFLEIDDSSLEKSSEKENIWYTMKINPKTLNLEYEFPKESTQNE